MGAQLWLLAVGSVYKIFGKQKMSTGNVMRSQVETRHMNCAAKERDSSRVSGPSTQTYRSRLGSKRQRDPRITEVHAQHLHGVGFRHAVHHAKLVDGLVLEHILRHLEEVLGLGGPG